MNIRCGLRASRRAVFIRFLLCRKGFLLRLYFQVLNAHGAESSRLREIALHTAQEVEVVWDDVAFQAGLSK